MRRITLGFILALAACDRTAPATDPRMVAEWMQTYYGLVRAERISPPVASRALAYAAVALYEGLAAATPTLRSLAGQLNGLDSLPQARPGARYDATLVAVSAERTVLDTLFAEGLTATRAALASLADSLVASRLALGLTETVRARSDTLGVSIGQAIVGWARQDGFDTTRTKPWRPPVGPQYWVNDSRANEYIPQNLTPAADFVALDNPAAALRPGAASERALVLTRPKPADIKTLKAVNPTGATEPWWGTLRPFAMRRPDECAPPAHIAFDPAAGSPFAAQARTVYETGKGLTEAERQIALYWADNAGQSGTPVGHWLSIASQMVDQLKLPADRAAEAFVLATVAQADAFIGVWHEKYRTNLIRPVTYIRRYLDARWEPFIITPPFSTYPSGHSGQSAAAAGVLTALLGNVAFEDSTNLSLGHAVRRFDSFTAAANEAGMSRIYGGIHYPMDNQGGQALGRCVAARVLERLHTRRPS